MESSSERAKSGAPRSIEDIGHPRFTLWESRGQRVGSVLIGLLVLGAALGFLGNGPFSETSATAGGLTVDYPRFLRRESIETIAVHLPPEAARDGTIALRIESAYVETLRLRETSPEPSSVTIEDDALVLEFDFESGGEPTVVFRVSPEVPGVLSGEFAVEDGDAVSIRHFVYP